MPSIATIAKSASALNTSCSETKSHWQDATTFASIFWLAPFIGQSIVSRVICLLPPSPKTQYSSISKVADSFADHGILQYLLMPCSLHRQPEFLHQFKQWCCWDNVLCLCAYLIHTDTGLAIQIMRLANEVTKPSIYCHFDTGLFY